MLTKRFRTICVLLICIAFTGCSPTTSGQQPVNPASAADITSTPQKTELVPTAIEFSDYTGNRINFLSTPNRVIALSGSLADIWMLAGGNLVGVTSDAIEEDRLHLDDNIQIVGSIKAPNLESIMLLNPDFVIMSADIPAHLEISESLRKLGIPHGLFHIEFFEDYLELLDVFTQITNNPDLYESNGIAVQERINEVITKANSMAFGKTYLLLRAYSSGTKAKGADTMTGAILEDFGLVNILSKYPSISEDISLEQILIDDPDYIFVTTMGSTDDAIEQFSSSFSDSPAWQSLTAIQNGNYYILPKKMFHYKPNAKWDISYMYILNILENQKLSES